MVKVFGRMVKLALSAVLAGVVAGCSIFAPSTQTLTISGQPAGAMVMVNGNTFAAPGQIQVKRNQQVSFLITKKGYHPATITSTATLSPFGLLDVVGGFCFLIPFVGLLAPGAFIHDQENFHYYLAPKE